MILLNIYDRITDRLTHMESLLPTLARIVFAGVLSVYYFNSGLTKIDGGFTASSGA